ATLTASDTKFTDTISSENNTLVDSYNSTNVTPSSIVLNVPTGGNILWAKTLNYNDIIAIGSLNYNSTSADARWGDDGENGSLIDAETQITLNLTTTLSGNNFINSVSGNSTATKNSFDLTIEYQYSDTYNYLNGSLVDKNNITTQIGKYYYKQTYKNVQTELDGYSTYVDQNRQTAVNSTDNIIVNGKVDKIVYYMPNSYNVTIKYNVIANQYDLNDLPPSAPADTTLIVKYDYPYSLSTPILNNYRAQSNVSGIMNNVNGITETISYNRVHTGGWIVPFDSVGTINNEERGLWEGDFKDVGDTHGNNPKNVVGQNEGTAEFINYGTNYGTSFNNTSNYNCYYLVYNSYDHFVTNKGAGFYFEFEFQVTGRTNASADSYNFGIILENANNNTGNGIRCDFITLDCKNATSGNGTYDKEVVVYNKRDNNWNTRGTFTYLPNYTQEFVKCAMWLDSSGVVNISFNNIKCFSYTSNVLADDLGKICYIGLQGWNVSYNVRNALYCQNPGVTEGTGLNDVKRANVDTVSDNYKNGEYHSNTIYDTDFYYETFITPTGFSNLNSQQGKVGIMLTSCENKNNQVFFYANLWDRSERQEIGMMTSLNGEWDVGSLADTTSKVLKIYENTLNVRKRYAIWKKGASIYFIFNETAYFVTYNPALAGDCTVSLKTMNVVFSFDGSVQDEDGSQYSEELSNYDKIAQERGINEVVLDGNFNDTAWSQEGRSRTIEKYETDGSGRYFKFKAFLGKSFMYIAAEAKVNEIIKGDVFLDASAILSSNLQVDFRGSDIVARSGINGKSLYNGFAHVTFVEVGNGVIRMEAAIPYVVYSKQANSSAITSLVARFSFGACEKSETLGWWGEDTTLEEDRNKWWCDLKYYTVTGSGIQLDTMVD
ncbi:MAG: hypothetical protein J6C97_03140, partial [Clostridia bacterium]|nr:hypothetical protein [Clostridia bacterium]